MKIIAALNGLGEYINTKDEALKAQINSLSNYNAWFNSANVTVAIDAWAKLLTSENLTHWVNAEGILENYTPKKVGLVLAGNIPMVGFHDILSVLITGHEAHIKLSSQDQQLIPMLSEKLISIAPELKNKIFYPERLNAVDAVIATGSDNSARYFEYYFGNKPHIIRKNRNSIAVLSGNETPEEINILGKDIFQYFGLGCRNVSKIYLPKNYDLTFLLAHLESYQPIADFHKYHNNYDFQKSLLLVNGVKHLDNGFLLLKESAALQAAISVLHYEFYENLEALTEKINADQEKIQCVASHLNLSINSQLVGFGETQQPGLTDYADGINTIAFLKKIAN